MTANKKGKGGKPVMSQTEAKVHRNNAGIKASQEARATGDDQAALDVLNDISGEIRECCGWKMYPVTVGSSLAIQRVAKYFTAWAEGRDPTEANYFWGAINNMAFSDPRRLNNMLGWKLGFNQVIAEAERLIYFVPMAERLPLIRHAETQLALAEALNPAPEPTQTTGGTQDGGNG